MPEKRKRQNVGLKMIGACAVGILLSLGLCGAGSYLGQGAAALSTIGVLLFFASVIGFFVGILIAISDAISSTSEKDKP